MKGVKMKRIRIQRAETRAQAIARLSRPWTEPVIEAADDRWIGPHDTPGRHTKRQDDVIELVARHGHSIKQVKAVAWVANRLAFELYLFDADGEPLVTVHPGGIREARTVDVGVPLIGVLPEWWRPAQ